MPVHPQVTAKGNGTSKGGTVWGKTLHSTRQYRAMMGPHFVVEFSLETYDALQSLQANDRHRSITAETANLL